MGKAMGSGRVTIARSSGPAENPGPGAYCPDHRTGVKLPDDFVVTPLQYVD